MKTMKIFTIIILFLTFKAFSQNSVINVNPVSKNKHIVLDSIYSKYLEQYRSFYVYLPSKYSKKVKYPVVYTTDGQLLTDSLYFNRMDSLIKNKIIKPFIMICVFSNEKKVENDNLQYRNYEYLKSMSYSKLIDNKNLYNAHLKFYSQELIKYTQEKYSISNKFDERYIFGFSNAATFCLSLSFEKPELFGKIILPSMYSSEYDIDKFINSKNSIILSGTYFFSYGTKEHNEISSIKKLEYQKHIKCVITRFKGGHDPEKWADELLSILKINLKP
jgi:enterochelin esterase-like enzyme